MAKGANDTPENKERLVDVLALTLLGELLSINSMELRRTLLVHRPVYSRYTADIEPI